MLIDIELTEDQALALRSCIAVCIRLFLDQPAPPAPVIAGFRADLVAQRDAVIGACDQYERALRIALPISEG